MKVWQRWYQNSSFTPIATYHGQGRSAISTDGLLDSTVSDCRNGIIEQVYISYTGWYYIVANGASASHGNTYGGYTGYLGGNGATVSGYFYLPAGTYLQVLVGSCGRISDGGTSTDGSGGGGGGASWVFKVTDDTETQNTYQILKSTKYNSDNAYTTDKVWECLICAAGGSSTGDSGYSTSYRANGNDASSTLYTKDNIGTPSTSSSSTGNGVGITYGLSQINTYDGLGGTYSRNSSISYGGFGCGAATDDGRAMGGGWNVSSNQSTSFCSGEYPQIALTGVAQEGNVAIFRCS